MPDTKCGENLTLSRDVTSSSSLIQTLSYRNLASQRKRTEAPEISGSALQKSAIIEKEVNKPKIPAAAENPAQGKNTPPRMGQKIDVFV